MSNFQEKISYKVFASLFTLLLTFTVFIYLLLTLFFPKFYYNYQLGVLDQQVARILQVAKTNQETKLKQALNDFVAKTEITPIVADENNQVFYIPGVELTDLGTMNPYQATVLREAQTVDVAERTQEIQKFQFKHQTYLLSYSPNIRTITDTTQIFIQFSPYFLLMTIVLSSLMAYLFSRKMVAPLKEMNQVAGKMVHLDFQNHLNVSSRDELGQLANRLNQLGITLKETLNELETKNQLLAFDLERQREVELLRKNFIMAISHELKSPLASAMGIVEAMEAGIPPYNNHERYLGKTYQILENMAHLIQEMLVVSNLEQHAQMMAEQSFDLNLYLQESVAKLQINPEFQAQQVNWCLAESGMIQTKPSLLQKALQNILNNAFLYSEKNGQIQITTKVTANGWFCSIYNTSQFISQTDQEKLFEPFYRIEKSGNKQTGGNGLGLFLVKEFLTTLELNFQFKTKDKGVVFELWRSAN